MRMRRNSRRRRSYSDTTWKPSSRKTHSSLLPCRLSSFTPNKPGERVQTIPTVLWHQYEFLRIRKLHWKKGSRFKSSSKHFKMHAEQQYSVWLWQQKHICSFNGTLRFFSDFFLGGGTWHWGSSPRLKSWANIIMKKTPSKTVRWPKSWECVFSAWWP